MHHTPLIATIALGFLVAFLFGLAASRLRLPPIVGYLMAGVVVGPFTPGFVADGDLAAELAEIGVILLMFGVGLHFSYRDLMKVQSIALPGAVAQIAVATLLGMGLAWMMGWSIAGGLIFGLALSVASTVVLLRAMEERQLLDTRSGHIAVGWLIVEDLAMVVALVLLPVLARVLPGGAAVADPAGGDSLLVSLGLTFGKLIAFVALMFIVGRRLIPWLLARVAGIGSRELFTLAVLAIGIGIAYGAAVLFDVSFALGAFLAGMILKESELSHKAAEDTLPLRDAFAVLFFVSVGMLFDPSVLLREPLAVLATLAIIVVGKSVAAFVIVKAFRYPSDTAVLISASLAQIGEFSFILVTLGLSLGVLPEAGRDLVLAGSILSILVNPLVFALADWLRTQRLRRLAAAELEAGVVAEDVAAPHRVAGAGHVLVVGYGRVGKRVVDSLAEERVPTVIVETDLERVEDLRRTGHTAILGNAARAEVLEAAGVAQATSLLVAVPNGLEAGEIVARAREMNPALRIVARAHLDSELEHILKSGADRVIMGEQEIARLMISDVRATSAAA
ncbi:Kef family K(+) transporter [Phenylobacterium sp. LjRoot219]|uniref:YbaL family putative K(+) efflux transporter n=1 Tax=Phenylobacterium sp. LjRoot219 TaxID=3342283 RepID=UPI003ECF4113